MPQPRLKHGRVLSAKDISPKSAAAKVELRVLAPILILCAFGLLMLYDASVVVSMSRYGHNFYYVTQQGISLTVGLIAMFIISKIDYHRWRPLAPLILALGLVLLLAVFIPGLGVSLGGATSWLKIGPIQFQPSYPLTIALIIYLASWLDSPKLDLSSVSQGLVPFLVMIGAIAAIIAIPQGDLGTAILLLVVCLVMYFLAGASLKHFLMLVPIALTGAAVLVISQPYRLQRVMTFLGGGKADALDADYQVNQLLIALGSGGLTGLGLGQSRQKYDWLPVVESDSIFAIIGEELGYIGVIIVVAIFAYLIWQSYDLSTRAPDTYGRLIIVGVTTFIAMQAFVNLFAAVSIIPLTGVPLPFISSGGTSLTVLLAALGIVLNISRQSAKA